MLKYLNPLYWLGLRAENAELHKIADRQARLLDALKPFSAAFDRVKAAHLAKAEDEPGFQQFLDVNTITPPGVTVGDFRRAWEALNP